VYFNAIPVMSDDVVYQSASTRGVRVPVGLPPQSAHAPEAHLDRAARQTAAKVGYDRVMGAD